MDRAPSGAGTFSLQPTGRRLELHAYRLGAGTSGAAASGDLAYVTVITPVMKVWIVQ
jgi:hypothetical protein